jgi:hypothetical protein
MGYYGNFRFLENTIYTATISDARSTPFVVNVVDTCALEFI